MTSTLFGKSSGKIIKLGSLEDSSSTRRRRRSTIVCIPPQTSVDNTNHCCAMEPGRTQLVEGSEHLMSHRSNTLAPWFWGGHAPGKMQKQIGRAAALEGGVVLELFEPRLQQFRKSTLPRSSRILPPHATHVTQCEIFVASPSFTALRRWGVGLEVELIQPEGRKRRSLFQLPTDRPIWPFYMKVDSFFCRLKT